MLPVLAIFGPTASGKSDVAEVLARRIGAEIVSADAMQVYAGLPVLTNQSPAACRLVGIWPLSHDGSVGEYATLAHVAIDEILEAGRVPVVVGGTGLYLRAALAELSVPPPGLDGARERLEEVYDGLGPSAAHAMLAATDAAAAAAVHPNDRRRVVRALELAEVGASLRPDSNRLWAGSYRHPTAVFALELARDALERRVRERTEAMFERGVESEVRHALAGEISTTASRAIGLREIAELPRSEAVEAIVRRTLRYAAYQRKWLRRLEGAVSLSADRPPEEIAREILEMARARELVPADRAG